MDNMSDTMISMFLKTIMKCIWYSYFYTIHGQCPLEEPGDENAQISLVPIPNYTDPQNELFCHWPFYNPIKAQETRSVSFYASI